jgi:hypothetical protein
MSDREELEALRRMAELEAKASGQIASQKPPAAPKPMAQPEPMSWIEKKLAGINIPPVVNQAADKIRGVAMGAAAPIVGLVQLGAKAIGQGEHINKAVQQKEEEYQRTRALRGSEGFDAYRLGGGVISPANLAPAGWLAKANTLKQLATRGAAVSAGMGAAAPVTDSEDFWTTKAIQIGAGGATGFVLTPVASKLVGSLANGVNNIVQRMRAPAGQNATQEAERILNMWANSPEARDAGMDLASLPASIREGVQRQIAQALSTGRQLNPAELIRAADFKSVGVNPTQAQLTRDPMQFAQERNMRGVSIGGQNPIANRFAEQGQSLRKVFSPGNTADDQYTAGTSLSRLLRQSDEPASASVDAAYSGARNMATGRAAELDTAAFSQSANNALDEGQLGSFLPAQVRGMLNDVSTGKIPFNVNTAVQMDRVLSAAQRSGNKAEAMAIGKVRDALNGAPIKTTEGVEAKAAFDKARNIARQRFEKIEGSPALKAALDEADPDRFVNKYVIGATTNELRGMLQAAKDVPEVRSIARAQIANHLRLKAFGNDMAGDQPFAPDRYVTELRKMGRDKLLQVFSPDEVEKLFAAGRVMSYIKTQPEGSAVNNSNTAAATMNLLSELSGKIGRFPGVNILRDSFRNFQNERSATAALRPEFTSRRSPVPTPVAAKLAQLLSSGSAGVSGAVAGEQGK